MIDTSAERTRVSAFSRRVLGRVPQPVKVALPFLLAVVVCALNTSVAIASGGEERTQGEIMKELGYQAFNLILLLGVFYYFGRGTVSEFFASRRSGIQSELTEAASLLAEAEQRNSDLQRRLVDLSSEVDEIKSSAAQRATDEADRIVADAKVAAERIRTDAQAAIDQELRRAQSSLRDEAADLALALAAGKLKDQVGDADRDRLIDEFITRIEPSGSGGAGTTGEGAH